MPAQFLRNSLTAMMTSTVVLNFNTCVVTPDAKLVVERREIVSRYLRGWFVLDCLGSVPLEIVTLIGGEALLEGGAGQASTLQV